MVSCMQRYRYLGNTEKNFKTLKLNNLFEAELQRICSDVQQNASIKE